VSIAGGLHGNRLRRHLEAVPGNVNCPHRGDPLGLLLRAAGPVAQGRAGQRRARTRRSRSGCPTAPWPRARRPSAVVAGNVETSQRLADTVLLALAELVDGLPAQGQGHHEQPRHRAARTGRTTRRSAAARARARGRRAHRACTSG
jgi:hypothetical protein